MAGEGKALAGVPVGGRARVRTVGGQGALRRRLLDMGLTPGVAVQVVGTAPGGDPMRIALRGYALTLRRVDAGAVEVEAGPGQRDAEQASQPAEMFLGDTFAKAILPPGERQSETGHGKTSGKKGRATGKTGAANRPLVLALAGNQNCGKTTLFNALTGAREDTGNFPGVTVEQKKAALSAFPHVTLVDLPGVYSLTPYSAEEAVTRDFLLSGGCDGIINIVDGGNLTRNLYLTAELLALGLPMVVALNMMDEVRAAGKAVHTAVLEQALGLRAFPVSALRGEGLAELADAACAAALSGKGPSPSFALGNEAGKTTKQGFHVSGSNGAGPALDKENGKERPIFGHTYARATTGAGAPQGPVYTRADTGAGATQGPVYTRPETGAGATQGPAPDNTFAQPFYPFPFLAPGPLARALSAVERACAPAAAAAGLPPAHAAARLLQGDGPLEKALALSREQQGALLSAVAELTAATNLDREAAFAAGRYAFLEKLTACAVTGGRDKGASVGVDRILTGKYTAVPVFLLAMALVFHLTFGPVGGGGAKALSALLGSLSRTVAQSMARAGVHPLVQSLVADGILAGVGSVAAFLPVILTLFFFLSLLEDSGYMARAAYVMDRPMGRLGLSGRAFVPLLMGFGCTVPAMMAARTLPGKSERLRACLLLPFMSCSAKVPIYAVFAAAFFPGRAAAVMAVLYAGGVGLAVLAAALLNALPSSDGSAPFVLEMPPYRLPSPKNVARLLWQRGRDFLSRAFTVVFLASILVWALTTLGPGFGPATAPSQSLLAALGRRLAPVFRPLGFSNWRVACALLAGLSAKEAALGCLSVVCALSPGSLAGALPALFPTAGAAAAFLAFTLLYTPCAAAVATARKELGPPVAAAMVAGQCLLAWGAAFLVYRLWPLVAG